MKSKGPKVLVAIGGWNDSEGSKYSNLANNPSARAKFISNVIQVTAASNKKAIPTYLMLIIKLII